MVGYPNRGKLHTRFACTGRGGAPTPIFYPTFLKVGEMFRKGNVFTFLLRQQQGYPPQAARTKFGLCDTAMRCADSRFAKPRISSKERFYVLFASTKRTGSSRRAAALSTPGDGSKLYRLCFFVLLPSFVPKLVCGATHFFGCFEPVRKGYCTSDARPIFFENGLLYYKLTGASRIRKG